MKKPRKNSPNRNPEDALLMKQIDDLIKSTLRDEKRKVPVNQVTSKLEMEALGATVSEFLNCFILVGYNSDGDPIKITLTHSQQEIDSLSTLISYMMTKGTQDPDNNDD